MFMPEEAGRVALPRVLAIDAAHMQVACAHLVGGEMLDYFSPVGSVRERGFQQRDRSIIAVQSHARTDPTGLK